ncbi:hypothetical protein [Nocardiopsis sp. FIRDI 009]|nr:hypothetical protein [Nocardiopsis sp. FIRDI 009]
MSSRVRRTTVIPFARTTAVPGGVVAASRGRAPAEAAVEDEE